MVPSDAKCHSLRIHTQHELHPQQILVVTRESLPSGRTILLLPHFPLAKSETAVLETTLGLTYHGNNSSSY